jgi:hypothetical protein
LSATFSDFQGTNFPGIGNVSVEPLWINPAGDDYRLSTNSPLAEAGKNSGPMGATFPVGAAMASSHPVLDTIELSSTNAVLRFWADSEKTYSVLASDSLSGNGWTKVADVFTAPLPHKVSLTNGLSSSSQFYRLVSPRLP